MAKALVSEILAVLRQFEVAGTRTTRKDILQAKEVAPRVGTRLISFVYEKTPYYIVVDAMADDDTQYLIDLIRTLQPRLHGEFVRNPHDSTTTYGLRFKFKDMYLYREVPQKRRLDVELAERYAELSRSTIQKYIKAGYVAVGGEKIVSSKYEVSKLDDIALTPPQKKDTSSHELPVLYIDDNVIVVNKPAGVLTHSKGALNDEFTVADFFRRYTTHGLDTSRPGVVHRLDRDTSGVIIGARNDEAAALLKKQFANRTVKKQYTAVVEGTPKLARANIDLPIGRNPSAPSNFRVEANGKDAQTEYEVKASNGMVSLVELRPKTGRTHQLRVHMQYLRTPIVGDRVYGVKKVNTRMYLHAHSLELTIPISSRKTFTAPIPEDFKDLVK